MKLGRNEPCHCGSGKKYKRCCLRKDQNERFAPPPAPDGLPVVDTGEDWEAEPSDEEPEDSAAFEDEGREPEQDPGEGKDFPSYRKKFACKEFDDSVPKISTDDQHIVDDWWQGFDKIYAEKKFDHRKCLALIEDFAAEHPRLTPNLYLHEEALFEIEDRYLRSDDYKTFIDFLKRFKEDCFEAYRLSGTYYDVSIVSYCLVHGLEEDIPSFFSIFKEYPDRDPDKLMELITLLQVTGNDRLLATLLEEIYPHIYYSPRVVGGHSFVYPMVIDALAKHAKPDYTEADLDALLVDLQTIDDTVPHFGLRMEREYWSEVLEQTFTRTFDDTFPTQKNDLTEYYSRIARHFKGYMHSVEHKTWQCAECLGNSVAAYLNAQLSKNKKPQNTFRFNRDIIDKHIGKHYRVVFYFQEVPSLACIDALLYFSEYMRQEHLITADVEVLNHRACVSLFDDIYKSFSKTCYGVRLFDDLKERHTR